jgi:type II secretory pathway component GspD/PulD (secretin)
VAGPDVTGQVSVNLYDVPFDEALNSILSVAGYSHFRSGNVIYVVPEAARGKLPVQTRDMQIATFHIDHADPTSVLATAKEFISEGGRIVLNEDTRILVVEDSPVHVGRLQTLIDTLDTPPRQVLISVKFVKVEYRDKLDVGTEFTYHTDGSDTGIRQLFTEGFHPATASGLFWGKTFSDNTDVFLSALADKGKTELMAAPEILALDGQEARILVGDKLGYKETTVTNETTQETVKFLDVGTELTVTPHIADDGAIRMVVHPKVSSGETTIAGVPNEATSELETVLLVHDGETIVLGGLLDRTRSRSRQQVPFLGDIPVLGLLFGKNTWQDDSSELLILITPHIVGPRATPFTARTIDTYGGPAEVIHDQETELEERLGPPPQ